MHSYHKLQQLAVSVDFLPFMKSHQAAVLANRCCFSMMEGRGINTLRVHMAMIFSAECTLPRPSAPQLYRSTNSGAVLNSPGLHSINGTCTPFSLPRRCVDQYLINGIRQP